MNRIIIFSFLFLTGCNLFVDDKVVIDIPQSSPTTIIPPDANVDISTTLNESSVLNFGSLAPQTSIEKVIEVKNTGDSVQTFNILALNPGPFSIVSTTCESTLSPDSSCKIVVQAQSPSGITVTQPLNIQNGAALQTVYLVASPLTITCPSGYNLNNGLCVADTSELLFAYAVNSITVSAGSSVTLSASISGGIPPYSVSGLLPVGLSVSSSGVISGSTSTIFSSTPYTLSVVDSNNSSKQFVLSITSVNSCATGYTLVNGVCNQDDAPLSLSYLESSKDFKVGISSSISPLVSGGKAPYSFTITPALPTGVSINSSTGVISGSASVSSSALSRVVTVTDGNSQSKDYTISISSSNACPNNFYLENGVCVALASQLALSYPSNSESIYVGLPYSISANLSGGNPPYSLNITPSLPSGLSFDSYTGKISGTPSIINPATSYTITLQDSDDIAVTETFSLETKVLSTLSLSYSAPSLYVGSSYEISPEVVGGVGIAYSMTCSGGMPSGLNFSVMSGVISGSPSIVQNKTCNMVVQDILGRTANYSLSLNIQNIPLVLTYSHPSISVGVGESVSSSPNLSGGIANSFDISPALSRGLSLDPTTGVISGSVTGIGPFNQSYTITAYTESRSTSTNITININYIPESVVATVEVSLVDEVLSFANNESEAQPITEVSAITPISPILIDHYTSIDPLNKFAVLSPVAQINPQSSINPNTNIASTVMVDPLRDVELSENVSSITYAPLKVKIKNNGLEFLSACELFNLSKDGSAICQTGSGTVVGQPQAEQTYELYLRTQNYFSIDPTLNFINLYIKKEYGNEHTFNLNTNASVSVQAKKITRNNLGFSRPGMGISLTPDIGEEYLEDSQWSFEYNNSVYFLAGKNDASGNPSKNILFKYDGVSVSEVFEINSGLDGYVDTTSLLKLRGNLLYFTTVLSGYDSILEYNLQTNELIKINNSYGIGGNYGYAYMEKGLIYDNQSGTFFFDFSDRKSYQVGPSGLMARTVKEFSDGFAFSTTDSSYLVKTSGGFSSRRISRLNNGLSGDNCKIVARYQNIINMICPVSATFSYKFFAYNIDTNVFSQISNLNTRNTSDLTYTPDPSSLALQVLENGTILFYNQNSAQVWKIYRIKGTTLTKISNFSGSSNVSDNISADDYTRKIMVSENKAYFLRYKSAELCITEYDDDNTSNYFKEITCSQDLSSSVYTDSRLRVIDDEKNILFHDYLIYKNQSKVENLNGRISQGGIVWFKAGKILYTDGNKYFYFDGNKHYQVSNTTGDPRVGDLVYSNPYGFVFNNKLMYFGIDVESGTNQLWEVTLPPSAVPPEGL